MIPASVKGPKKQSPSTLKRNNLRKKAFLAKKAEEKQVEPQLVKSPANCSEKKFKCNQCDHEMSSKDSLDTHMAEEHNAHNAEIPCKECGHVSKNPDDMKQHEKKVITLNRSMDLLNVKSPVKRLSLMNCGVTSVKINYLTDQL